MPNLILPGYAKTAEMRPAPGRRCVAAAADSILFGGIGPPRVPGMIAPPGEAPKLVTDEKVDNEPAKLSSPASSTDVVDVRDTPQ